MLTLKNLHFQYQTQAVLQNLSMHIQQAEIVSIMGESGCGKSTLLKLIYGLYDWQQGEIIFQNKKLLGPKANLVPGEKNMKWVSQDFDMMPNHTVAENVGKFLSNLDAAKKEKEINKLLSVVEMKPFYHQKAKYLSGGQQQRIAIARALSQQPKLLLLDEPFAQIDNSRRQKLRRKIFEYVKKKNITTLLVTHDIEDALSYSDSIIIMKEGKIIQKGSPKNVYQNPKNKYVAQLFGDVNAVPLAVFPNQEGKKIIYYHQISEHKEGVKAIVSQSLFRGKEYVVEVQIDSQKIYFTSSTNHTVGTELNLQFTPEP